MNKIMVFLVFFFSIRNAYGQKDTAKPALQFSGYMDLYYGYSFNRPDSNELPSYFYNYTRLDEVNVDLAYLRAAYTTEKIRANLALMAGTYPQANLSSEPELLRHVYEANAGVRLIRNLWLDAGIFSSHIGLESAVSKDCWNLSRSIMGENSPYYESGVKLTYNPNAVWLVSTLVLNGWQRIERRNGNTTPTFGTQVTFKPGENITLNSSTFIGNDQPDSAKRMRYFHDLYGIFQLTPHWGITGSFDYGIEQKSKGSHRYHNWDGWQLIVRYSLNDRFSAAARAEGYTDKNGVIVNQWNDGGLNVLAYSLNADYAVNANALVRVEGKYLKGGKDPFFILSSLAISF